MPEEETEIRRVTRSKWKTIRPPAVLDRRTDHAGETEQRMEPSTQAAVVVQ